MSDTKRLDPAITSAYSRGLCAAIKDTAFGRGYHDGQSMAQRLIESGASSSELEKIGRVVADTLAEAREESK